MDKYKLKKEKLENFSLFKNEEIILLISGLGIINAKEATLLLLNSYEIRKSDKLINIGICGASKEYEIGELMEISSVNYTDKSYKFNEKNEKTIHCLNTEASENKYEIVDMESFGFYEATKGMKNAYMFKVISDHFEPHKVTKEKTKSLIFNKIDEIMKKVHN